jgi:hypothetical protein
MKLPFRRISSWKRLKKKPFNNFFLKKVKEVFRRFAYGKVEPELPGIEICLD